MAIKASHCWGVASTAALAITLAWATQHSWLLNPQANQLQNRLAQTFGLMPLVAKRPDLLAIASHAKLQKKPPQKGYVILGQIHNAYAVPINAPSILLQQMDRDNLLLQELSFTATQWGHKTPSIQPGELANFELQLSNWPNSSWGYQLRLSD